MAWIKELDSIATLQKETAWLMFFEGHLEVPEGWQVPLALQRAGVKPADDPAERLIQYVRFAVILDEVDDQKLDLVYGFPNTTSESVLARVGYETLGCVQRWFKPLRWDDLRLRL